jgi:hypothetical protein
MNALDIAVYKFSNDFQRRRAAYRPKGGKGERTNLASNLTSNSMGKRKRPHQIADNAGENKERSTVQTVVGPAYGQVHELMPQVRLVPRKFDLNFDLGLAKAETPLSSKGACKRLLRPYFAVSSLPGALRLDDSLPSIGACWKAG